MSMAGLRAVALADKITKKWKAGPQAVAKLIAQCVQMERGYGLIEGMEFTVGALKKALDARQDRFTAEQLEPLVEIMKELEQQSMALRGMNAKVERVQPDSVQVENVEVVEAEVVNE